MEMIRQLVDWCVGSRCAGCGRSGAVLCGLCRDVLLRERAPAGAIAADRGVAAQIVRRAKRGSGTAVAPRLVDVALERCRMGRLVLPAVDLVTWVPADVGRLRRRGRHLPELLARALARRLDVPARCLLERRSSTRQRGLDHVARVHNVAAAFASLPSRAPQLPVRVCLVDDVRTTGATLAAAARALPASCELASTLVAVAVLDRHGRASDDHAGATGFSFPGVNGGEASLQERAARFTVCGLPDHTARSIE